VIAFPSGGCNPHRSWFRKNWLGYNYTHTFPSSIDYSEFVVELNGINEMVPTLESLRENKTGWHLSLFLGLVMSCWCQVMLLMYYWVS
jgi:hypothetical protein